MSSAVTKRFGKSLAAHGLAQGLAIIVQIVSMPLFIANWGVIRYGDWLALTALTGYLSIADLSFGATAANEMTMLAGADRKDDVRRVYRSAWLLIIGISLTALLIATALVLGLPFDQWLALKTFSRHEAVLTMLFCVGQIVLAQQGSVIGAAFRAGGYYATGVWAGDSLKFLEFLALVIIVSNGGGPVLLTGSVLVIRSISYLVQYAYVRRLVPWLSLGIKDASLEVIRPLVGPALAYNALPLAQATTLQGTVLVAHAVAGPVAIVAFNATRTLSRLVFQVVSMITNSTWPEFSRAIGAMDLDLARRLHRRACQIGVWLAICGSGVTALVAPLLYPRWSQHKAPFYPDVFAVMLAVVVLSSFWNVSYAVPISVNRHQKITFAYLGAAIAGLLCSILFGKMLGLLGVALGLVPAELIMIAAVLPVSMRILEDRSSIFTLVAPPFSWFWSKIKRAIRRPEASV